MGHSAMTRRWQTILGAWTAVGLAHALVRAAADPSLAAFLRTAAFELPLALSWAALTPAVGAWDRILTDRWKSVWARLIGHAPLLVTIALVHAAIRRLLFLVLGGALTVPFQVTLLFFADVVVASYLIAAWLSRMVQGEEYRAAGEYRTELLRGELSAARMQFLDLQLRPHFLFNALSAISEFAHEAPAKAARLTNNVIRLLGSASGDSAGLVRLDEELDALEPYLDIQRERFPEWLTVDVSVDEPARQALVPRFILQPLVENAVHHGLVGRRQAGRILVRASAAGSRLIIEVVDNGAGLDAQQYRERRGMGLDNVRNRLATMYGDRASIALLERDAGTSARIEVPLTTTAVPPARPETEVPRFPAAVSDSGLARLSGARLLKVVVVAWAVVALFRVQHSVAYLWLRDRMSAEAFASALRFDVIVMLVWLGFTPLVMLLFRAVPLRSGTLLRGTLLHVGACVAIALAHASVTPLVMAPSSATLSVQPLAELFSWNVAVYAILVVLLHLRDVHRSTLRHDAEAMRLQADLAATRFDQVLLELHPQLLVGALRRVEDLVSTDPRRAESTLADIGEFLRGTLDVMRESHVPLHREAALTESYARIAAAGGRAEGSLQLSVPPEAANAAVPKGLLRAMVRVAADGSDRTVTARVWRATGRRDAPLSVSMPRSPKRQGDDQAMERLRAYEARNMIRIIDADAEVTVEV